MPQIRLNLEYLFEAFSLTLIYLTTKNLSDEFSTQFSDLRSQKTKFRLFGTPFDLDELRVPEKFQMELINLKCNPQLKSKFSPCDSLINFYKVNLSHDEYQTTFFLYFLKKSYFYSKLK